MVQALVARYNTSEYALQVWKISRNIVLIEVNVPKYEQIIPALDQIVQKLDRGTFKIKDTMDMFYVHKILNNIRRERQPDKKVAAAVMKKLSPYLGKHEKVMLVR